ncbi:uncharacterized protein SPSK_10479 [Sporothrix schenckii 1099-18]|uniref:Uncharacterized protein n=1 Tax=Sporothrix schenckii 1099-18 TaxID=1397361 RepID=A0A0F2MCN6_SPOSC|nr:uncharacterized protein SPSK_10479 [Sporothrix schenckii 1099-18]KJR86595.1 hypothetical protein SPSK_10479 [Sporothrix schenckii 1099-18]
MASGASKGKSDTAVTIGLAFWSDSCICHYRKQRRLVKRRHLRRNTSHRNHTFFAWHAHICTTTRPRRQILPPRPVVQLASRISLITWPAAHADSGQSRPSFHRRVDRGPGAPSDGRGTDMNINIYGAAGLLTRFWLRRTMLAPAPKLCEE